MEDSLEIFIGKIAKELELPATLIVKPDEEFRKLEKWDSMNALIILAFVNVEYRKSFTGKDLSSCKTFRDVYEIIIKKS